MDIGILILRLVVGLIMTAHGAQKLFGWFGGGGIEGTTGFLKSLGFTPGRVFAVLLGSVEFLGGLLLALGLLTPLSAMTIVAVMTTAIVAVHGAAGFFNQQGGMEFPLLLAVSAVVIVITGPGEYSVDSAIGFEMAGYEWGVAAAVFGFVLGAIASFIRGVSSQELRSH